MDRYPLGEHFHLQDLPATRFRDPVGTEYRQADGCVVLKAKDPEPGHSCPTCGDQHGRGMTLYTLSQPTDARA